MSIHSLTGITPVQNIQITFNITSASGWLIWSPPSFPSENSVISYHIYIENQHGQLLYNDITNDTSYELYNLTVCDIYTATVIAHSGEYSSNNVTIQDEYNGGMLTISCSAHFELNLITEYYVMISPDHDVIFNDHNNSVDVEFHVIVS